MADCKPTEPRHEIQFRQLLEEAVTKPGTLMRAYSLSLANSRNQAATGV
jgi:hypothetical protein